MCKDDGCENCPISKAINKLAEYEDLEEKGLLVKFPCAIGDAVYIPKTYYYIGLKKKNRPIIFQNAVKRIELSKGRVKVVTIGSSGIIEFDSDDFGKSIFTRLKQAEQALKEMEEENE